MVIKSTLYDQSSITKMAQIKSKIQPLVGLNIPAPGSAKGLTNLLFSKSVTGEKREYNVEQVSSLPEIQLASIFSLGSRYSSRLQYPVRYSYSSQVYLVVSSSYSVKICISITVGILSLHVVTLMITTPFEV